MSKFCQNCGNRLNDNADICLNCGIMIKKETSQRNNNETSDWAWALIIPVLIIIVPIIVAILTYSIIVYSIY